MDGDQQYLTERDALERELDHLRVHPNGRKFLASVRLLAGDGINYDPPAKVDGQAKIAEVMGVDVRTVQRWEPRLEAAGLLTIERRPGRTSSYRLEMSRLFDRPGVPLATPEAKRPLRDAPGQKRLFDPSRGRREAKSPTAAPSWAMRLIVRLRKLLRLRPTTAEPPTPDTPDSLHANPRQLELEPPTVTSSTPDSCDGEPPTPATVEGATPDSLGPNPRQLAPRTHDTPDSLAPSMDPDPSPFKDPYICKSMERSPPDGLLETCASRDGPALPISTTAVIEPQSRWPVTLEPKQLDDPAVLEQLFPIAVAAGWMTDSQVDRLNFYALAHYCRRKQKGDRSKIRNVIGLFTSFLDGSYLAKSKWPRPWRERISSADEDWARQAASSLQQLQGAVPAEHESRSREAQAASRADEPELERDRQLDALKKLGRT